MKERTPFNIGDVVVVTGNTSPPFSADGRRGIQHHLSIGDECIVLSHNPGGAPSYRVRSISGTLRQSVSPQHLEPKQINNNAQAAFKLSQSY